MVRHQWSGQGSPYWLYMLARHTPARLSGLYDPRQNIPVRASYQKSRIISRPASANAGNRFILYLDTNLEPSGTPAHLKSGHANLANCT